MALESIALIPSGYKANKLYCQLPVDGGADLTTSRASSATRVNKNGLIEDVTTGVPRLDYTNGSCPELLLEPQSTNRVTYSEDFTDASWVKSNVGSASAISVTSNYALSPDGSVNADRLVGSLNGGTTISDNAYIQFTDSGISNTSNSYYLKSNTGADQVMYIRVSTDVVAIVVTPEWQRFNLSVVGSTDYTQIGIRGADYGGLTNSDSIDVLIWGAQREELSYPTSYIRTNGSSVTRIADAVSGNSSLGQVINSSEGVLYFEGRFLTDEYSAFAGIYLRDLASLNDSVQIRTDIGNPNALQFYMFDGGVEQVGTTYVASDITQNFKVAFKYELNNVKVYFNGSEIVSDTNATMPSGLNQLTFINNGFRVKELKVYDTALTDAELQTLTTL